MKTNDTAGAKWTQGQVLTLVLLVLGYTGYYFCRANFSVAKPSIIDDLVSQGMTKDAAKQALGVIATWGTLSYAFGKFIAGAIVGSILPVTFYEWTSPLLLPLMLVMGAIGGAAYAAIPALLKTRFNTNEILTSLMLVYIAQLFGGLSQLDAGGWHSRAFAGEALPTLEALARFCLANGHLLNIEIKPTPGTESATGEAVARLAAQLWQGAAVPPLLTSFKPDA